MDESSPPISKSMPSVVFREDLNRGRWGFSAVSPFPARPRGVLEWVRTSPVPGGSLPSVTRPVPASRAVTLDKCSASRERALCCTHPPGTRCHGKMARSKTEKLTSQGIYFIDYHTLITDSTMQSVDYTRSPGRFPARPEAQARRPSLETPNPLAAQSQVNCIARPRSWG